jgi:hypothetical protein
MKVSSISGKLSSSYIYFKSNSNIRRMTEPAGKVCRYDDFYDTDVKNHSIKGRYGDKNYSLMINDDKGMRISGKIGPYPVYVSIAKRRGFLGLSRGKTGISGYVGDKEIHLTCKTDFFSQHLTGKYDNKDIDMTLWDSISSDSSYIDGENIDISIDKASNAVTGKASVEPELLPILTSLAMIKDKL